VRRHLGKFCGEFADRREVVVHRSEGKILHRHPPWGISLLFPAVAGPNAASESQAAQTRIHKSFDTAAQNPSQ
jgi:hypothetical protein